MNLSNIETKFIVITTDEWLQYSNCPIQRDTERHAAMAQTQHLSEYSPTHSFVSAALMPGGEIVKLDGHTRAYLWERKLLKAPESLYVSLYKVESKEQLNELYKHFDNSLATETVRDKITGCYQSYNFKPNSHLIKYGCMNSSLHLLHKNIQRRLDIYKIIPQWIDEIKLIDTKDFTKTKFSTGVLACLLVTVKVHKKSAFFFWERFNANEGLKCGRKKNGVQALSDFLILQKIRKKSGYSAFGDSASILDYGITCFEKDLSNTLAERFKPTKVREYLESNNIKLY